MSDDTSAALPLRPADVWRPAHSHSGAGSLNVNANAGVQKNYNQAGCGNRQFNADVINYNADPLPDYCGTYVYTSLQPVAHYVARPELQREVEEQMLRGRAARTSRNTLLVLVGLGGAGKSQLALNYLHARRGDYTAVFWVDARLRKSVERDYVQIYSLLYRNQGASDSIQLDIDRVITAVRAWFHARQGRWLFVFDNADSLDDDKDPYYVNLRRYIPEVPDVETIITTRSRTATDMTELEAVKVGELAPDEAVDLFVRWSKLHNPTKDVLEEARRIVAELGCLALAVTIAGAYVAAKPHSNIAEYLPEYRRRRKALLDRYPNQQIHQYGESVLSTWETSCSMIVTQCPTAVILLSLFAFLDPDDIFPELFYPKADSLTTNSEDGRDNWGGLQPPGAPFEEGLLNEGLEALSTYSLIRWSDERGAYSMHKLVHAWGFLRLKAEEQAQFSQISLVFLRWAVLGQRLDVVAKSRVPPHILSSVARLREWKSTSGQVPKSSLDLIEALADFVSDTGQFCAEFELRSFEEKERRRLGEKDKEGWTRCLGSLADILRRQGKYEASEAVNRSALEMYEKAGMEEHPNALTTANHLAMALQLQGQHDAAEEMHWRALKGDEKALGTQHPHTLMSMSNLAVTLYSLGKHKAAEEMIHQTLAGREKVLGREHHHTLMSVSNLASVLQDQEKYEEAEAMSRRALEGMEKTLGEKHPDTLMSVWCLADVLDDLDRRDEASMLYERAVAGFTATLGEQHPWTLECRRNYAAIGDSGVDVT